MSKPEQKAFAGWEHCYSLSNSEIELIITTDVGPRIIYLGFKGGANMFAEFEEMLGKTGGDTWNIYGGHRLWHAPEIPGRTYYPDNAPVKLEEHAGFVRVIQTVEPTTGIQKEIDITLDAEANHARLVHRLRNLNLWTVELAPWALSVMAPGGTAIIPIPPRGSHEENLLPTNVLTMWAYTNLSDPRWTLGEQFILLRQDASATTPQKIGISVPDGWAAYANNGNLFLKTFTHQPGANYPDGGCSVETFTNSRMLEVESLGPLLNLAPGAEVEHVEDWYLFQGVQPPQGDADVIANVLPLVQPVLG